MIEATGSDCAITGILLTGGSSRRMGFDKASMLIDGVACAARVAAVMQQVVGKAVEVGPGVSGLPSVHERKPGSGPLAAICDGVDALSGSGFPGPALVLACDLPLLTDAVLRPLVTWPGRCSVIPVVGGRPQTLCARWSREDLSRAAELVAAGARSMMALLDRCEPVLLDETAWSGPLDLRRFADVDTPADLARLGLAGRVDAGSQRAVATDLGAGRQIQHPSAARDDEAPRRGGGETRGGGQDR